MKQLFQLFCFLVCTSAFLYSCNTGFIEIEKECYFQKDIQFLQALINNSQYKKKPPSSDLNPIKLGWQIWENGVINIDAHANNGRNDFIFRCFVFN